jgi:hypothetical protein
VDHRWEWCSMDLQISSFLMTITDSYIRSISRNRIKAPSYCGRLQVPSSLSRTSSLVKRMRLYPHLPIRKLCLQSQLL